MNQSPYKAFAIAHIKGNETAPLLSGYVKFLQMKNYVLVIASIKGLPHNNTGFFGFHIHEGSSCTGENFSDTGNHYNPQNAPHPSHAGDMPPLINCNGGAYMTFATNRFRLKDISGRTVVIHDMADDFNTQPSGNAGAKIGCGKINKTRHNMNPVL